MSFPTVGKTAPDFCLLNQDGHAVRLSDFIGRSHVVLYFYPKAMTPGCTLQACGLRDTKADLAELGAVALGVSPDPVPRLARFTEKQNLNFDLLSDEDLVAANAYGVWGPKKFMGREFLGILRTTFIIDRSGTLVHVMPKVKTRTHHQDVLNQLPELDH